VRSEPPVKVVLVKDVATLGKRGDTCSVADGYARNYLLPRGLAVEATPANIKKFEVERSASERRTERETAQAEASAARLEGFSLTVRAKAGEEGRLFGSVTTKDIAAGIKSVLGLDLDRRQIDLPDPIKSTGSYRAVVRLGRSIPREITVVVEPSE
jgi:large subunit ribosomal protein L9